MHVYLRYSYYSGKLYVSSSEIISSFTISLNSLYHSHFPLGKQPSHRAYAFICFEFGSLRFIVKAVGNILA